MLFPPFAYAQEAIVERFVNHDALGRIELAGVPRLLLFASLFFSHTGRYAGFQLCYDIRFILLSIVLSLGGREF